MTATHTAHPLTGTCYSTDNEIMGEIAMAINEIDDVRYGSAVVDLIRRQITAKLEDGRRVRATIIFE